MTASLTIMAILLFIICIALIAVPLLLLLATYILNGVAYLKMAKKVGIKNGWLGFVPYAVYYLLGKFAEKDNEIYHPQGKQVKWSKIMLISCIAYVCIDMLTMISSAMLGFICGTLEGFNSKTALVASIITVIGTLLLVVILLSAMTAFLVLEYIVFYKLLHLMTPKNAWWILLLGMLVSGIAFTVAILVFAFSKNFPTYLTEAGEMPKAPEEVETPEAVEATVNAAE